VVFVSGFIKGSGGREIWGCGSARPYGYWCWLGMRRVVMVCYLKFNVVKAENMSVQELYFEKMYVLEILQNMILKQLKLMKGCKL